MEQLFQRGQGNFPSFPDKKLAISFADQLFAFLFTPRRDSIEQLLAIYEGLRDIFSSLVFDVLKDEVIAKQQAVVFFDAIPDIYQWLLKDAAAIVEFDPAAESIEEVLVAYPGFFATAIYRFAHQLHTQQLHTLPRLFSEYAHSRTGIDIHPGAQIGTSFFIDHGTGIVIGGTAVIGNHVKIYHGVTLGALNVAKELAHKKRHPTIEDNVIIYSGATILGGNTTVGNHSVIGGNVWLTHSVEPHSIVYHKSEVVVRDKNPLPEPLNFVI
ncbi:serine acetyltransferase [Taibaiella soli]|uniref:Serine acetyltransferase n=2 Tax=Taibaiella soli TaxID=1649169 RepID=A0A2W2B7C4_9BACT|nr:serine acetyltransferase [Taibaiella soli]